MSAEEQKTTIQAQKSEETAAAPAAADKGKAVDIPNFDDEELEEEESEDENVDESMQVEEDEEEEEDDLAEIDTSNIISGGRRTRGKQIDYTKEAANQPAAEDEEDDEDFEMAE
ncbi:hypothetical protein YB2330_002128 [Saitoella coloradoensis]